MMKTYDIRDIPDCIFGNNYQQHDCGLSSISDPNSSMGIFVDFYSDSPSLSIYFTINYKPVKKLESPILTNGFSYCVKNQSNVIVKQNNCYSWGGDNNVSIIKRKSRSMLHYLFFLPSFNIIDDFRISVDDGHRIYTKRPKSRPLVVIGRDLISGRGCCYPNSMIAFELAQAFNMNIISIYYGDNSNDWITSTIKKLRPYSIIIDGTKSVTSINGC